MMMRFRSLTILKRFMLNHPNSFRNTTIHLLDKYFYIKYKQGLPNYFTLVELKDVLDGMCVVKDMNKPTREDLLYALAMLDELGMITTPEDMQDEDIVTWTLIEEPLNFIDRLIHNFVNLIP